ncbi:MAG: PAS domain S-box protein [Gammaproteobacteria bacterium]|nr:PAS domain S-box protein [Gammaproteobacteria bacterium]MBL7000672.1 PAS domain S-box protein [Gammaproteobacteria bacterium]
MSHEKDLRALQLEVKRLKVALKNVDKLEQQREQSRHAMLSMLEDLEESRQTIEHAKREWVDAFDAMIDPVFIHDAEFRVVRANQAYITRAGKTYEEVIGQYYYHCFPENDEPLASCKKKLVANDSVFEDEEIELDSGEIFLSRAFAIRDDSGNYVHSIHIMQNVTAERMAMRVLKENEAMLDSILRASEAGIMLVIDRNAHFVNDALCELTGYAYKELVGSSTRMLYCDDAEFERVGQDLYPQLLQKGSAETETCFKHKQGQSLDVWVKGSQVDKHDPAQGAILTIMDISERKKSARMLEENEEKFRKMTATAQDAILMMDSQGKISYFNPAAEKIFGYSADEILGHNLHDVITPERYRSDARKGFEKFRETGEGAVLGRILNLEALRRDGSEFPVELSISAMRLNGEWIAVAFLRDITQRFEMEKKMRQENRARRVISASNSALIHAGDEATLLNTISKLIVAEETYPLAWVVLSDEDEGQHYRVAAYSGLIGANELEGLGNTWANTEHGQGPAARAIRECSRQLVTDAQRSEPCETCRKMATKYDYHSILSMPLKLTGSDDCFGALTITAKGLEDFSPEEVELLQELADDLAYGIIALRTNIARDEAERQQHIILEKLKTNMISTVQAMADTVEVRDPYTAGHQRTVAELSSAIAIEMGLPDNEVEGIRIAATIHDLGKIYVPSEILSKPGRITPIEFELIKTHSQVGYDILKNIDFPWPIADMVRQHHERIDGSGYPQGLKGDRISQGAKIIAVADVTEAIASHRPYRAALGIDFALKTVEKDRGTAFQAEVVDACLRLFREKGYKLDLH